MKMETLEEHMETLSERDLKVVIIGVERLASHFKAERFKRIVCQLMTEVHSEIKCTYLIPYKEWGDCIFRLHSLSGNVITYEFENTIS